MNETAAFIDFGIAVLAMVVGLAIGYLVGYTHGTEEFGDDE